jgi:hypothetical protein
VYTGVRYERVVKKKCTKPAGSFAHRPFPIGCHLHDATRSDLAIEHEAVH